MTSKELDRKIRNSGRLTFGDLPPRVIVQEILVHRVLWKDDSKLEIEPRYMHFGYFRRDRLRHIWFMFASSTWEKNVILDSKRLVCLILFKRFEPEIYHSLVKSSTEMKCLERLEIKYPPKSSYLRNLFEKENCFPRLHILGLVGICLDDDLVICQKSNTFERIRNLNLSNRTSLSPNNERSIFSKLGKNIECISLGGISFLGPFELYLPNLRKIILRKSNNLNFRNVNYNKIEFLSFSIENEETFRLFEEFYLRSKNLKVLEISSQYFFFTNLEETWRHRLYSMILNPKDNPLKKLRKLLLNECFNFTGTSNSIFGGENLEYLKINYCRELVEDVFFKEYPRLRRLVMYHHFMPPTRPWKIFEHVEVFSWHISDLNAPSFVDLYQLNRSTFSKNLKELKISNDAKKLTDEELEKIFLNNLKKLILRCCHFVTGKGIKRANFKSLEEILAKGCKKFDGKIVKEIQGIKVTATDIF